MHYISIEHDKDYKNEMCTWWSVPSTEATKCDTNTNLRRLATHLLQQVDQSFTSRRHSGHGSASATRNNTSAKDQTTIAKASKASSEYHTMEALCGGPGYTGTVGCRAVTYSTSSGTKSGSSSEKQLVKQGWAHAYSTSSTPPTEGLISRSCTGYDKDQVKVYLQTHLLMQDFISEKVFANNFISQVTQLLWKNQLGTTGLPVRSSPGTQPHTISENNSRYEKIPTQTLVFVTTPWLIQYRGHDYSNRFDTLRRLYNFTHK
jgi:hypothetical protein